MKNVATTPPKLSIACIGECMVELTGPPFAELQQGFGGDTYNTAVYLRRCLPETVSVHYLTAIGEDPLSDALLNAWQQEGIQADLCRRLPNKLPGLYQIFVDDEGERKFLYWRNDSAAKYLFDGQQPETLATQLATFDWVYLSGITLAILTPSGRRCLFDALALYRDNGGKIAFDNNYRPTLWPSKHESQQAYRTMLNLTDVALLTEDDERLHFELQTSDEIFDHTHCREMVLKRGADACLVMTDDQLDEVPAIRVSTVVDTTAAGDSFAAGYLAKRLLGAEPADAARWGHNVAAQVIQAPGAVISQHLTQNLKLGQST